MSTETNEDWFVKGSPKPSTKGSSKIRTTEEIELKATPIRSKSPARKERSNGYDLFKFCHFDDCHFFYPALFFWFFLKTSRSFIGDLSF